jgi:hypothetical protein
MVCIGAYILGPSGKGLSTILTIPPLLIPEILAVIVEDGLAISLNPI